MFKFLRRIAELEERVKELEGPCGEYIYYPVSNFMKIDNVSIVPFYKHQIMSTHDDYLQIRFYDMIEGIWVKNKDVIFYSDLKKAILEAARKKIINRLNKEKGKGISDG